MLSALLLIDRTRVHFFPYLAKGEKGLGFKAVYQVTDRPHIFSNGFSFRFGDAVLPTTAPVWVEAPPEGMDRADFGIEGRPGTTIFLPFREDGRVRLGHGSMSSAAFLESLATSVSPQYVMFLRKISRVLFRNRSSGTALTVQRTVDHEAGRLTLECSSSSNSSRISSKGASTCRHEWLFKSRPFEVPEGQFRAGRRVGSTTVAVALRRAPPDSDSPEASLACACCGLPPHKEHEPLAYSFLPIAVSGLPIEVQADFLLGASRETIDARDSWNAWLRGAVVDLAQEMVLDLAQGTSAARSNGRCSWLSLVPAPGVVRLQALATLRSELLTRIRTLPILPSCGGQLVPPRSVRTVKPEVLKAVTEQELSAIVGVHILAPDCPLDPTALARDLGVHPLTVDEFLRVVAAVAQAGKLEQMKPKARLTWLAAALAAVEVLAPSRAHAQRALHTLLVHQSVRFLPLVDDGIAAAPLSPEDPVVWLQQGGNAVGLIRTFHLAAVDVSSKSPLAPFKHLLIDLGCAEVTGEAVLARSVQPRMRQLSRELRLKHGPGATVFPAEGVAARDLELIAGAASLLKSAGLSLAGGGLTSLLLVGSDLSTGRPVIITPAACAVYRPPSPASRARAAELLAGSDVPCIVLEGAETYSLVEGLAAGTDSGICSVRAFPLDMGGEAEDLRRLLAWALQQR